MTNEPEPTIDEEIAAGDMIVYDTIDELIESLNDDDSEQSNTSDDE